MLMTIGFFIYPVINLITIAALDIVSKKAIGTAAGFIGLFGYLGKMVAIEGLRLDRRQVLKVPGRRRRLDDRPLHRSSSQRASRPLCLPSRGRCARGHS